MSRCVNAHKEEKNILPNWMFSCFFPILLFVFCVCRLLMAFYSKNSGLVWQKKSILYAFCALRLEQVHIAIDLCWFEIGLTFAYTNLWRKIHVYKLSICTLQKKLSHFILREMICGMCVCFSLRSYQYYMEQYKLVFISQKPLCFIITIYTKKKRNRKDLDTI